jgi:hypothetical protein
MLRPNRLKRKLRERATGCWIFLAGGAKHELAEAQAKP